jgi:colanic acid/amylovoran biosynthesis glycosyltransferase
MSKFNIAYFINQYPKVSHSFIRREILALERQGFSVERIALRGWDGELVDVEDLRERGQTQYILQDGVGSLLLGMLRIIFARPIRFARALATAVRMGIRAERPLPYHFIYLAEACRLLPLLEAANSQHVHAHFGTNSAEVVMLAHMLGGPSYSFTVHGSEEFDKPEFLKLREKVKHATFVVAISDFCRSQLFRWAEYSDWKKIRVVHCGIDPAFHRGPPVPIPSAPRLVCVGRLCEQKGQLLLVEAVAQLVRKGVEIELVLAGDGEMRQEIELQIAQRKLQKQIRITGWISGDQVREELLAARALVMSSFAEGLPVVIMEAMALRRPVLSTHIAGIPELVESGKHGKLFPPGDVDALAAAMQEFLAQPLALVEAMGEAAHYRALERHSIDSEAGKLARLMLAVTSETEPPRKLTEKNPSYDAAA